jgi:hypothetical protein
VQGWFSRFHIASQTSSRVSLLVVASKFGVASYTIGVGRYLGAMFLLAEQLGAPGAAEAIKRSRHGAAGRVTKQQY